MQQSFAHRFIVWTFICVASAAPSLFVAVNLHPRADQIAAMVLGILIFITAYAYASGTEFARRLHQRPFAREALYIGYGTRIGISFLFPLGFIVDGYSGVVSTGIVEFVFGRVDSFLTVLLTTLVQGGVLNVVLLIYMLGIYLLQVMFRKKPQQPGVCGECGYDLRASRDVCPECGTAISGPDPD